MIPNFPNTMINNTKCLAEWVGNKTGITRNYAQANVQPNHQANAEIYPAAISFISGIVMIYALYSAISITIQLAILPIKLVIAVSIAILAREIFVLCQNSSEEGCKSLTKLRNCTKKEAEALAKNTFFNAFWIQVYQAG